MESTRGPDLNSLRTEGALVVSCENLGLRYLIHHVRIETQPLFLSPPSGSLNNTLFYFLFPLELFKYIFIFIFSFPILFS